MRFWPSFFLRAGALVAAFVFWALSSQNVRAAVGLSSGINLANLDRTCKPCNDFYQFAAGGWIKRHAIPAAYPAFGNFNVLSDSNTDILHTILEKAAAAHNTPGSNAQKIGDYYASCMNVAGVDAAGLTPLQPLLARISTITDLKILPAVLADLHDAGVSAFFGFGSESDFKNSRMNIASIGSGGLGMPDRDYYLKDDARSKSLRDAYVSHVTNMFKLAGDSATQAAAQAQTVMTIETAMARNTMTRVERRDPAKIYHKMSLADAKALAPNFDWTAYFKAAGAPAFDTINIASPDYIKAVVGTQLAGMSAADLQTYLRWHVLHAYAPLLSTPFVDENFSFYGKTLSGTTAQLPRWKRCVSATNRALGEDLGRFYVGQTFSPAAKARALTMVKNIKAALRADFSTLAWMTPATRARAVAKLDAFDLKIGYPDKWRDYGNLSVVPTSYVQNYVASSRFETAFDLAKIGNPVDRTEWGMSTPTVNAYYNPTVNEIVFPAGILQPPFFNPNADDAINYGAIGAVVGHESTHGFDDEGRKFDLNGNLTDWWTPADATAFDAKAQCIVNQWDALSPLPGLHENGKLVQGEEIADLGGLTIAYKAFQKAQAGKPRRVIDGFTPEQRFFMGWAQVWTSNQREDYTRLLVNTDVHGYDKFRVNATLMNMPEFAKAWFCKLGDKMVRPAANRCQIW
ncbi:MAG: M13 family metallopeptidase [Candidatus Baltobacteraceae bacterium]